MKKYLMPLILLSIILTGCGVNKETNNIIDSEAKMENAENQAVEPTYHEQLDQFEEFNHLEDTIDNIAELKIEVVEDKADIRIILFKDGSGEPAYKSIFTKNNNHLKILQLNTDKPPLFNEDI